MAKMKEAKVIKPTCFDDVEKLIDGLKNRESVIVDFDGVPSVAARRMLDFLCGATFALSGEVNRQKYKKYILIPHGVRINRVKNG